MIETDEQDTVTGDNCAREPIHIIGQIQPHGALFALSEPDLVVRHVSANVQTFLGFSPETLLGRSFEAVLGATQFDLFRLQVRSDDVMRLNALRVAGSGREDLNCVAHRYDGMLIAEFEPADATPALATLNLAAIIQLLLSRMEAAGDIIDLCQIGADQIGRLSGFERVMIYRFDNEWNGEVIAETAGKRRPTPISGCAFRPAIFRPKRDGCSWSINCARSPTSAARRYRSYRRSISRPASRWI